MSTPIVSLIISVYNGEEFLPECIAGIDAQTFHDYEVLVVDDGSSDSTPEILYQWSRENERVRVLTRKNDGLTSALNLAISHARGKYLARHDADDVSSPYRLEQQVKFLDTHIDTVLVGSHVVEFNNSKSLISRYSPPDDHRFIVNVLRKGENPLVHGSVLLRKEAFEKLREGYRFVYSQDYDLYLRISSLGELRIISELLYAFRNHSSRTAVRSKELKRHIHKLIMQMNGLIPLDTDGKSIISNCSGDRPLWQVLQENIIHNKLVDNEKKANAHYNMSLIGDNLEKNRKIASLLSAFRAISICPAWWKTWFSIPYAFIGITIPSSLRGRWRGRSIISRYRKPCNTPSLNQLFRNLDFQSNRDNQSS